MVPEKHDTMQSGEHEGVGSNRVRLMSRRKFCFAPVRETIQRQRESPVTRRLNEVYSRVSSEVDEAFFRAQLKTLSFEPWD